MEHAITVKTEQKYEKQYGYTYDFILTCSCGATLQIAHSMEGVIRVAKQHKSDVIDAALGLKFSIHGVDASGISLY